MIVAKTYVANGNKIVAVCDAELLGKKFEENGLQIDLSGNFYKGKETPEDELQQMLKNAYVADFVGKKSVDFAVRNGIVKKENVVTVSGIPHAQTFSV